MRIDKYLKSSRWIKRRTLAKEACDAGKIYVNEKVAKPGTEVEVGDLIKMQFGGKTIIIKVLMLDEHVSKEQAKDMYELVAES